MSTGTSPPPRRSRILTLLNALSMVSTTLKRTILAFLIAVIAAVAIWTGMVQRQSRLLADRQKAADGVLLEMTRDQKLTKEQLAAIQALGLSNVKDLREDLDRFRAEISRLQEQERLLKTQASAKTAELASSRAKTTQVRAKALQAAEQLKLLREQLVKWNTTYAPLLVNDRGRRIAANGEYLTLALAALQRDRPKLVDVDAWGQALDEYLQPLELAYREKDGSAVVAPEQETGIDKIRADVGRTVSQVEADVLVLDTLMKDSERFDPGQSTIKQVLDNRRVEQAKALANDLDAARAAAVAEKAESLKAEERALEAKRVETEIHRLRNEQRVEDLKQTADDAETKRRFDDVKRLQAKQDLLKEFERDLPQIRRLLAAFITPGHQYRNDGKEGPVSLSLLTSKGALVPKIDGTSMLSFLANVNDRPGGSLTNPSTPEQLRIAQEMLRKYGNLMVEKGFLDK